MRIALLDIHSKDRASNKTMAGGFGTSSSYNARSNKSLLVRLLEIIKKTSTNIPLLEFAYLNRIFSDRGHNVRIYYYSKEIEEADLYIVYLSLVEYQREIESIKEIRRRYPGARIGLVGTLVTVFPEKFKGYADFLVKGAVEGFFLKHQGDYFSLSGVIEAPAIENLDELPFPDWSFFPVYTFRHRFFFGNIPVYPILGSRGCSFSCGYYCAYPILAGEKVCFRSLESLISEILYLKNKYRARAVLFRDPNFSIDIRRAKEFCKILLARKIKIKWACEIHLAQLDKELVDLMHDSGLQAITVGIESRDREVIKDSKRYNAEESHIIAMVRYCESKGIKVMAGYIFGNLKDTPETVKDTLEFAKLLNTSFAQFYISTPYPGTAYYRDIKDRITTDNWEAFDTYSLVFDHPNFSADELESKKKEAYIQYYFRPRWAMRFMGGIIRGFFNW